MLRTPTYDCGGHRLTGCIDRAAFAVPGNIAAGIFAYGNMGRNTLRGPGLFNTDLSVFKTFALAERLRFTFRAEAFNAFNHASFNNPNANIEVPQFGNITSTSVGARVMQFGGKISF